MNFISTRNAAPSVGLSAAIAAGLAPDGGLYVPAQLPHPRALHPGATLADTAAGLLAPFFAGDGLVNQRAVNIRAVALATGNDDPAAGWVPPRNLHTTNWNQNPAHIYRHR